MTTSPPQSPTTASTSGLPDAAGSSVVASGVVAPDNTPAVPAVDASWGFPDPEAVTTTDDPPVRPKPKAGRRPGAVWGYFTPVRTEQNKTHAVCRFCARRCAGVAARMITHLLHKCPSIPAPDRAIVTATLAQDAPPEKRRRVDTSAAAPATMETAASSVDDKTLTAALHNVAVACLRTQTPLALVEDAFFRDALALLRPQSLAMIQQTDALALRESVCASVAQETAEWMQQSDVFTLMHNAATHEWRGADAQRRVVLVAEDPGTWRTDIETHVVMMGVDTIVGFCCDTQSVYNALVSDPAKAKLPLGRIKLVSKCLLSETTRLWTLVIDAVPQLVTLIVGAAETAQTYASMTVGPTTTEVNPPQPGELTLQDLSTAGWSLLFRVVKRLDTMGQSLQLHEAEAGKTLARMAFWKDLSAADVLLSPFASVYIASESKHVTSSHIVLCWLWLLATIERSSLVDTVKRKPLVDAVLAAITQSIEDHHLVALLLDPRTRGCGFSATGRRKVKTLVAQVAVRLWPAKFEASAPDIPSPARQSLLTQLGHYMDKTACFSDEVVWEMAHSAAPERFWRDYAQDAPELTALAMAVLAFVPTVRQTSEFLDDAKSEPFDARQILFHFERNRKNGDYDVATVAAKYTELMAMAGEKTAPSATDASALNVAELVIATLERLRLAGAPAPDPVVGLMSDVDATWFAFESETDYHEIDAARLRLLPRPSLAV